MSLFRAPNGLNELPEERSEFLFILIGKSTVAFLTGQSWRVLKSWYTGAQNNNFGTVSQTDLTRVKSRLQRRLLADQGQHSELYQTWKEAILTTSLAYQS